MLDCQYVIVFPTTKKAPDSHSFYVAGSVRQVRWPSLIYILQFPRGFGCYTAVMIFSILFFLPALLPLVLGVALPQSSPAAAAPSATCDQSCQIDNALGKLLSQNASIVHTSVNDPRWSDFDAPNPSTVVNVATEKDVQITVCSLELLLQHPLIAKST